MMTEQDSTPISEGDEQQGDFEKLMSTRMKEEQEKVSEAFGQASEALKEMMDKDDNLRHIGYMMLLGYRLIQWAAGKASEYDGMTMLMLEILVGAQERKSHEAFKFVELVEDLEKVQMPWLESQRKDALMRQVARERRLKDFARKLRRKDIGLPFHSMTKACGDEGFTHDKTIYIVGPSEAVSTVIRFCLREYQRAGGTAALLSTVANDKDEKTARLILPPGQWRNCAEVYGSTLRILEPVTRGFPNRPIGLLGVESLKETFLVSMPPMEESQRIVFAANVFAQYQAERGIAMLVGVSTDDVPEGIDPMAMLPWVADRAHVRVALEESKLVGGSRNIVVGNDVMVYDQLLERMKD
jgi:hypothetical protein